MAESYPVFVIRTFTLSSSFDEDRLRMDLCDAQGATQASMLTRRLLDQAVPRMVQEAERLAAGPIPADLTLPIAQERLRMERKSNPVAPIRTSPEGELWLCTTMQFAPREDGVIWILKGRGTEEARMFLSSTNLRATLDIFANRYKSMDWGRERFPEWLVEADPVSPASLKALH